MNKWEKSLREDKSSHERKNPSFSSSLLDEIYRSITDGDEDHKELHFYRETMAKKHSLRGSRGVGEEEMARVRGAGVTDKWMEKKGSEKVVSRHQRRSLPEIDKKWQYYQDPLFFSSSSSSSDSSYGGFSSSETESMKSFFAPPPRPRPIRTSRLERSEQALSYGHSEFHMFDDYRHHSAITREPSKSEEEIIKSKSRALKMYGNLKKVKQPISPGGRLATFLNSLFTAGNSKKSTKTTSSAGGCEDWSSERKLNSQPSTCSSASSFARSCLNKNSPSVKEKSRNDAKRTVRFFPVSIIVDEDCRPCGRKCVYGEEASTQMSASRKITKRNEEDLKFQDQTRRVEAAARELHRNFHQKKNDNIFNKFHVNYDEEDEDDDAASCSSSDLFELDHLALIGNDRYQEELPVYETTHIDTNRAIANGLLV